MARKQGTVERLCSALGLWPVASGQWPEGQWPVEWAVEWPVGSGKWPVASGQWQVAAAQEAKRHRGQEAKRHRGQEPRAQEAQRPREEAQRPREEALRPRGQRMQINASPVASGRGRGQRAEGGGQAKRPRGTEAKRPRGLEAMSLQIVGGGRSKN